MIFLWVLKFSRRDPMLFLAKPPRAKIQPNWILQFFTLANAKRGECIVIGLAASSTSKGPQINTKGPMVSIKVTNCSIQLGWIFARGGFAKNSIGSRPEVKVPFLHLVRVGGWLDVMVFSIHDFFHTIERIEMKLKTYH